MIPGPADHDLCLQDAGFDDFADSDAAGDVAFASFVARALEFGAQVGAPRMVSGGYPVEGNPLRRFFARGARPTLADAIVWAATDDKLHRVKCISERQQRQCCECREGTLAAGCPTKRTVLEWNRLARTLSATGGGA